MGLDIFTTDDEKNFHISYIGFTNMRGYFILSKYGTELYEDYEELVKWCTSFIRPDGKCPIDEDEFYKTIGDLTILINHSDCDGELTSEECQQLLPCLMVDEDNLKYTKHYENNPEYVENRIKLMYEFIDLISYCANNPDIKLIFG